jgi:hypothetical protein
MFMECKEWDLKSGEMISRALLMEVQKLYGI